MCGKADYGDLLPQSIYPDSVTSVQSEDNAVLNVKIQVSVDKPTLFHVHDLDRRRGPPPTADSSSKNSEPQHLAAKKMELVHLLPIEMEVFLGPTYPLNDPPTVRRISSQGWLGKEWSSIVERRLREGELVYCKPGDGDQGGSYRAAHAC